VQIAEQELLEVVATLVHFIVVELRTTLLLHHSNTMLPMDSSQYCTAANLAFLKLGF